MNSRRAFIAILAGILAAPLAGEAQPAGKVPRICYLATNVADSRHWREAFLQGLRDLGYVEGPNVMIELTRGDGTESSLAA